MPSISNDLSMQQIVMLAISIEQHNAILFEELSRRFRSYSPDSSIFFEALASEERQHEQQLLDIYHELFGAIDPEIIPPPDELAEYSSSLSSMMTHFFVTDSAMARSLLEMALAIERYTRQFYLDIANNASDPTLKQTLEKLGAYEEAHEKLFLERLAEHEKSDR